MSTKQTQQFLIDHIPDHPRDIVSFTVSSLGCSRTTVARHLNHLVKQGKVIKSGYKKGIVYALSSSLNQTFKVDLTGNQDEFHIWQQYLKKVKVPWRKNIVDILEYVFTEVLNNAFDHSLGSTATVIVKQEGNQLYLCIADNGIGIFKKVAQALSMEDLREAILQLEKGKFTTDRQNHSGEGLFFTARIADQICITANNIRYLRDNIEEDWFVESVKVGPGTKIEFYIDVQSNKQLTDQFQRYQDDESFAFVKTDITVELSKFGHDSYISRSQAKRVLRNLEEFKVIMLDFKRVRIVGQGFVDEVFRVYQNRFPEKVIRYCNANDDVIFMIERGKLLNPHLRHITRND